MLDESTAMTLAQQAGLSKTTSVFANGFFIAVECPHDALEGDTRTFGDKE